MIPLMKEIRHSIQRKRNRRDISGTLRNDNQAKEDRNTVEPFAAQTDWILVLDILAGLMV